MEILEASENSHKMMKMKDLDSVLCSQGTCFSISKVNYFMFFTLEFEAHRSLRLIALNLTLKSFIHYYFLIQNYFCF